MEQKNILFEITPEQAKQLCKFYNVEYNIKSISFEYDVCQLLNRLIDETTA